MPDHHAAATETTAPGQTTHSLSRQAALDLVSCLQTFATQNTNAVLAIIGDAPFTANTHYPEGDLVFGGGRWRAYYHAHEMPGAHDPAAHGHFHIFVRPRDAEEGFAHVVGLAVDGQGQPLRWFTTNHWVTGETWRTGAQLGQDMPPPEPEDAHLAARWLSAMLRFSAPALAVLLDERDAALAAHQSRTTQSEETVRADRTLYVLSEREIDLMGELSAALALEPGD